MNILKRTLYHQILALLAIPVVVQVCLLVWYGSLINQLQILENQQARARQIIGRSNWISARTYALLVGRLGELSSGNPEYGRLRKNSEADLGVELPEFEDLFKNDPQQAARVQKLEAMNNALISRLSEMKQDQTVPAGALRTNVAKSNEVAGANLFDDPAVSQLVADMPRIRHEILAAEQSHSAVNNMALPQMLESAKQIIYAFIVMDVALGAVLIYVFTRNIAARLNVVSQNSLRLARREPFLPPVTGDDEIAQLDRLFRHNAAIINELSRRERAIIENAVDVICSIAVDGRFTRVSPSCAEAWGYAPEELIGMRLDQIAISKELSEHLLKNAKTQGQVSQFENEMRRKDGRTIDMLWSCSWSEEEQTFFAVAHDITERKILERQKQEFLSMVTHDLRTPLAAMYSYCELILDGVYGPMSDRMNSMTARMLKNTKDMNKMVDEFLELQKIESGAVVINYTEFVLAELLEGCIDHVRDVAESRQIVITLQAAPIKIQADYNRLAHVFSNLLTNAIKFSKKNSSIEVEAIEETESAKITVIDHGKGIQAQYREVIFDRFQQSEKADEKRGFGLGLAICKAIVEEHHGKIGVESQPGEGSRFWVQLPLKSTTMANDANGTSDSIRAKQTSSTSDGAQVIEVTSTSETAQYIEGRKTCDTNQASCATDTIQVDQAARITEGS